MERRKFIGLGLAGVAAAAIQTVSKADLLKEHPNAFSDKTTDSALKDLYGTSTTTKNDKVDLKVPDIAENGAAVPVTVSTTIPNPKTMSIIIDGNPRPLAVAWEIPEGTLPEFSTRIKMRKTGKVILVVEDKDGKLYSMTKQVKVTVGGCGG
jgi:sulfur-oxidizing protein SoxY